MTRRSMMRLVRQGKTKVDGAGFLVTWDVDSRDKSAVNRLTYFLFGRPGRAVAPREAAGFVWLDGVRYLGQSTLFVRPNRLRLLRATLERLRIAHDAHPVTLH